MKNKNKSMIKKNKRKTCNKQKMFKVFWPPHEGIISKRTYGKNKKQKEINLKTERKQVFIKRK